MNPFRLVGTPRAALAPTPGAGRLSRVLGAGAGRLGRGQAGRERPRGRGVARVQKTSKKASNSQKHESGFGDM